MFWWANMSSHRYDQWNCRGLCHSRSFRVIQVGQCWRKPSGMWRVLGALCMWLWECFIDSVHMTSFSRQHASTPLVSSDLLLSPSPFFNTTVGLCKLSRTCFIHSIYPVSIVYHEHVWYLSHYLYSYTEKTVLHHRDVITQTEKERKKSKSHSLELPNLFYQPINTFMFQQSAQRRIAEVADSEGDFRQSGNEWMFSPLGSGSQIQK